MLRRLSFSETDTPGEVNKALNDVIDELNKNEEYNKKVEEFNDSVEKGDK